MKNTLLLIVIALSYNLFSQVTAHAGNDTIVCVSLNNTSQLQLGASDVATGGIPPYTYSWETNYNIVFGSTTYLLTASDFLNDTTIVHPTVINIEDDPVTFILTVTDSLGNIDKDTIIVSPSIFNTHLFEWTHNMISGDSIEFVSLPNVGGGIPPLTYLWKPNHGLTDSTLYTNFWIKPTESTSYYITVEDSKGCIVTGTPVFHVYVGHLDIEDIISSNDNVIKIFPNPSNGNIHINTEDLNINRISIYNTNKKLMTEVELNTNTLDLSHYPKGVYLIKIETETSVVTKKIILQ